MIRNIAIAASGVLSLATFVGACLLMGLEAPVDRGLRSIPFGFVTAPRPLRALIEDHGVRRVLSLADGDRVALPPGGALVTSGDADIDGLRFTTKPVTADGMPAVSLVVYDVESSAQWTYTVDGGTVRWISGRGSSGLGALGGAAACSSVIGLAGFALAWLVPKR